MPRRIYDEQYVNEKEMKKGHSHISLKKRLKLIQLVFVGKFSIYKAAKRLNICHPTAKFIIKSYKNGRIHEYDGEDLPLPFRNNNQLVTDGSSPEIQKQEVVAQTPIQNQTINEMNLCILLDFHRQSANCCPVLLLCLISIGILCQLFKIYITPCFQPFQIKYSIFYYLFIMEKGKRPFYSGFLYFQLISQVFNFQGIMGQMGLDCFFLEEKEARFHDTAFLAFLLMHAKPIEPLAMFLKVFSFMRLIHNNSWLKVIIFKSAPQYFFYFIAPSINLFEVSRSLEIL